MDRLTSSEVVPRSASTVLALRPNESGFDVLMVRRAREARFMGGAHVFPGGALEDADRGREAATVIRWTGDPDELPWRAAALRELAEEAGLVLGSAFEPGTATGAAFYRRASAAGVVLDGDALVYVSNWVTPRGLPRRFDTRFYLVAVPAGAAVRSDRREVYDAVWIAPAEAILAADTGRWQVEMPTRAHLEMLARCSDVAGALALAGSAERIEPRLVVDDHGVWSAVLPGDPRFEGAGP